MINQKTLEDFIPQFPLELKGSIWGITTFFNPADYRNRYKNYLKFRKESLRQGLKLLVVELVFNERSFELKTSDADILLQIRGHEENILWQKEALLNLALARLPKDCDKVVWVDCDILFKNENWISETSLLLQKYKIVQPFSWLINLEDGQDDVDPLKVPFGHGDGRQFYGMAYRVAECGHKVIEERYTHNGHVGFAWAARRETLERIGFFDRTPCHNADTLMARMFYGSNITIKTIPDKLILDYEKWGETVLREVAGSVYYTPGFVFHLWHGKFTDRGYSNMFVNILKEFDFDPASDISKNADGIWEWSTDKKLLRLKLKEYFYSRKEDVKL